MSKEATFGQAAQTLDLLNDLNHEEVKFIHDGYLSDFVRAMKEGIIISRKSFQRDIGLMNALQDMEPQIAACNYDNLIWIDEFLKKYRGIAAIHFERLDYVKTFSGSQMFRISTFTFRQDMVLEEIKESLARFESARTWHLAEIDHFIAFLKSYPNTHLHCDICCLGSMSDPAGDTNYKSDKGLKLCPANDGNVLHFFENKVGHPLTLKRGTSVLAVSFD